MTALSEGPGIEHLPIIDTDVHTSVFGDPVLAKHLPKRLGEYMGMRGMQTALAGDRPRPRPFGSRLDAFSPEGGMPGSDTEFVRKQLLDQHGFSGAVMNDIPVIATGGKAFPDEYVMQWATALNNARAEKWFTADDRWYASVTLAYEAIGAEKEIERCREMDGVGDRWVQVLMGPDNEKPAGHQKYWPIYEACEHYGIPLGMHVWSNRHITGTGVPNYYLEEHVDFAGYNFWTVSSMIFSGVFDRFPGLKVAFIELAWSWLVPFAWRLDHAYDLMRAEVPHLERRPSEYVADHFWFSTQPMEEPEQLGWFDDVYQMFEDTVGDKLMYSSDYPHWDFDYPETLPASLPVSTRRKILGENASKLYGIPLREGTGLAVELASA